MFLIPVRCRAMPCRVVHDRMGMISGKRTKSSKARGITRGETVVASTHLSSAVLDTGADGAPVFPEKAATCFFTAANPLLFCKDPISVCG